MIVRNGHTVVGEDITKGFLPAGVIFPYGGKAAPLGYLLCDGSEVSKTDYADLYAVIGDMYGTSSDETKFKLPDARECSPVGAGTSARTDLGTHDALSLGKYRADGFKSHNHKGATGSESAHEKFSWSGSHRHPIEANLNGTPDGQWDHDDSSNNRYWNGGVNTSNSYQNGYGYGNSGVYTDYESLSVSGTCSGDHTHSISNEGGNSTHGKQFAVNYIIKY